MPQIARKATEPTPDTCQVEWVNRIRSATKRDEVLKQANHAQRADGWSIGFLPEVAWHQAIEQGRMVACYNNADLVGWCMFCTNIIRELRIVQIWVRPDARMIVHGRSIVDAIESRVAIPRHCWQLRLWCAEDLAANLFWAALGFNNRGWRWGRSHHHPRRHLLWTRPTMWCALLDQSQAATHGLLAEPHDRPTAAHPHHPRRTEENRA